MRAFRAFKTARAVFGGAAALGMAALVAYAACASTSGALDLGAVVRYSPARLLALSFFSVKIL
jgi:hypothetical protein